MWILGAIQMKLKDFIEKGQVKKISKDISLIKSIIIAAEIDLRFLKELEVNYGKLL